MFFFFSSSMPWWANLVMLAFGLASSGVFDGHGLGGVWDGYDDHHGGPGVVGGVLQTLALVLGGAMVCVSAAYLFRPDWAREHLGFLWGIGGAGLGLHGAFNFAFDVDIGAGAGDQQQGHPRGDGLSEDAVRAKMSALPTELYEPRDILRDKSVRELRAMLRRRKVTVGKDVLEKEDLLALFETDGSWNSACTICLEEFEHGDVLRLLHCRHFFHIECVDKWAVSSMQRVRACPMCNEAMWPGSS